MTAKFYDIYFRFKTNIEKINNAHKSLQILFIEYTFLNYFNFSSSMASGSRLNKWANTSRNPHNANTDDVIKIYSYYMQLLH